MQSSWVNNSFPSTPLGGSNHYSTPNNRLPHLEDNSDYLSISGVCFSEDFSDGTEMNGHISKASIGTPIDSGSPITQAVLRASIPQVCDYS